MTTIKSFVFSPFQENTYVVYDDTKECVIIDPGCYLSGEKRLLADFIRKEGLSPVQLLNTHCHLDHVFGNQFVKETYDIPLLMHRGELPVLHSLVATGQKYGIPCEASPEPDAFLEDGDEVKFGNTTFKVLLTPGHSPASISFFCELSRFVIAGDVLFERSIGRTDLPGGDYKTLLNSIISRLLPLGDEVVVYNGHGNATTIGKEKQWNPFLKQAGI